MSDDIKKFLTKKYPYIFDEDTQPEDIDSLEKILKQVEDYYQSIISCMPGNIYWSDKNANAIGCNKNVLNFMNLRSIEEFRGLSFEKTAEHTTWSAEAVNSFKRDSLEVIESGKAKINIEEPPIPDQRGNSIIFLTTRAPLFNSHNKIIGMIGVSIDITERKNMEIRLKKAKLAAEIANHSRSDFIANMSHDIKTPLAGIIGMADMLINQQTDAATVNYLEDILSAGQQLMEFFDNCLEIAKSEDENAVFMNENFNLKLLINEIVNLFQPAIIHKGLKLYVYFDDKIPDYLLGSRRSLLRILINLVGNAVKFTEAGSISIGVKLGAKSTNKKIIALITIKDTGIGIPKDKHAHIFERFTRLSQANKGTNTGSGLGLYLVKKYLESMQGEIHLSSIENEGSQFMIAVPLEISLLAPIEHEAADAFTPIPSISYSKPEINKTTEFPKNTPHKSIKVLLVEDNLIAQTVVKSILTSLDCEVDTATNGKDAVDLFDAGKYQIIFTDLGLPDIYGYNIINYFKKIEEGTFHRTPIIILTAHITDEIKKECIEIGADEILHKPLLSEKAKYILEKYVLSVNSKIIV